MSRTVFFNEITCPVKPSIEEIKRKIVTRVDDRGQIRMKWEDNSTFALDPETDLFVIYGGKK